MQETTPTQAPNRAREIQVPPETRALSTLSGIDYENAILADIDAVDDSVQGRTGEQWARAVLEDAPAGTRRALTLGWTGFGLRLRPARSDRHVLGWPVRHSAPDHILLGTTSANGLQAELLIQRRPHALLFASFIRHDTDDARTLWAEAEHLHAPMMCQLIDQAVARAAPEAGSSD